MLEGVERLTVIALMQVVDHLLGKGEGVANFFAVFARIDVVNILNLFAVFIDNGLVQTLFNLAAKLPSSISFCMYSGRMKVERA